MSNTDKGGASILGDSTLGESFLDSQNRWIDLRRSRGGLNDDDYEALVRLYMDFDPIHRSGGIPPMIESKIRIWLDVILVDTAVVAWHGTTAVGLVVLIPDGPHQHELAIFIHQDYHHAGIGDRLVSTILTDAATYGIQRVYRTTRRKPTALAVG